MKVEVNISDYLSSDEIKDIIASEIRKKVAQDAERILSNTAYYCAYKVIDDAIDATGKKAIKEKALSIISEMESYHIFRKADEWDKTDSRAYTYLQQAIEENKSVIKDRVLESIRGYDYERVLRQDDTIVDIFIEALSAGFSKRGEQ